MRHFISNIINDILFILLYIRSRIKRNDRNASGVLLIRFAHIGDFIVWLDAAKEFRSIYPDEKITFLCDKSKDVKMLAEKMGYFDEVLVLETRGYGRLKSICKIMKQTYRIVINADPSRTILSDDFVLAVGANERIAVKTDLTRISRRKAHYSDKIYNRVIPCDGIKTMELIRNAQFIRGLSKEHRFRADLPVIPEFLSNAVITEKNYFVICAGGNTPLQYWNEEKFAAVINYIFEKDPDIKCVAIGVETEADEFRKIAAGVIQTNRIISLIGRTNILEYIEVVRNARWLITNDTSAAHIAGAVETPSVAVAVSWNTGRFYPYQTENKPAGHILPIGIRADLACSGCGEYGIDAAHLKCLENHRARCVNRVKTTQMLEIVDRFMEKESNGQRKVKQNKIYRS